MPKGWKLKPLEFKITENGCHEVTSHSTDSHGYPHYVRDGKEWRIHRHIFYQHHGYLPEVVLHECDNPLCVNIEHLRGGSQQENIQDMVNKKRGLVGQKNGMSKLTEDDVRAIRKDIRTLKQIAADYGISFQTVSDIKLFRYWKDVV